MSASRAASWLLLVGLVRGAGFERMLVMCLTWSMRAVTEFWSVARAAVMVCWDFCKSVVVVCRLQIVVWISLSSWKDVIPIRARRESRVVSRAAKWLSMLVWMLWMRVAFCGSDKCMSFISPGTSSLTANGEPAC